LADLKWRPPCRAAYNAGMGPELTEIDGWLRGGGRVIAASERASRAVVAAYHRARQAEGLSAWPAPLVQDWKSFLQSTWEEQSLQGNGEERLLLNSLQEQSLWEQIAASHGCDAALLAGSRQRLAALAMEAHALLCAYAPRFLHANNRVAWQGDAEAFSNWLSAFEDACRVGKLVSSARLHFELTSQLQRDSAATGQQERPALLLVGFDRILPAQRSVLDAWGSWRQAVYGEPAVHAHFHEARDTQEELAACARWCGSRIVSNPNARLLVITQQASILRGQIERAFLRHTGSAALVEFSLGVPLGQVHLARGAYLLLRWLTGALAEHELDWLFASGQTAATAEETSALQRVMWTVRESGLQRPEWTLHSFLRQPAVSDNLPAAWVSRMTSAAQRLGEFARRPQRPLDWAELVPQLLQSAGWLGGRTLSSAEFQALQRWQQTVEASGSLGFDGRRIDWTAFLSILARALEATVFDLESRDAPILIAGPAESAGLTADAVWFLGADEESWPAGGTTHPLLPLPVQREARMPHATVQRDWELSHAITVRLLASAPELHFSYARQKDGTETRPSRLIEQLVGAAEKLPEEPSARAAQTVLFEDYSRIPFPPGRVERGASVLTAQSQCPFKAFASARLNARSWDAAESGFTAAQRGQLLHAVLHAVWNGPPNGIRSLKELQALKNRRAFIASHVDRVFRDELPTSLRERMPHRYLELEQERLIRIVGEWLDYEAARVDFTVMETEAKRSLHLEGLSFNVRLDRIDRLNDDSLLVIDYKSGEVSPKSWELPRPDDVQLPLYADFALDREHEKVGGLVFAQVRTGKPGFAGFVRDARAALLPGLRGNTNLVRKKLTDEQLNAWRQCIERLAKEFLAGNAQIDPRQYPETCQRCGLQVLCRVEGSENQALLGWADDSEDDGAEDA
jgi:ATP-dependent helicase/nuclease subunit B